MNKDKQVDYKNRIKSILRQEIGQPSEALLEFFNTHVWRTKQTEQTRKQWADITQRALEEFVRESREARDDNNAVSTKHEAVAKQSPGEVVRRDLPGYYLG